MQNDMRDRLIELHKKAHDEWLRKEYEHETDKSIAEYVVDELLANGVIVPPVKVGDTVYAVKGCFYLPYAYLIKPKEYIEHEALLQDISKTVIFSGRTGHISAEMRGANKVKERIHAAPAADVVEVVRCENCKWAMKLTEAEEMVYTTDCVMCSQLHPDGERIAMLRDSFCNYGERKDGAE